MQKHERTILSWGRAQQFQHSVHPLNWLDDLQVDLSKVNTPLLPYGMGRSYGDCCLNDSGLLLDVRGLRRFIAFDDTTGVLRCEAGATLAEIIRVFLPRGWFPAVVPGTKNVTIGGAIANDIHGKNHHVAGTFGRYVRQFELVRSDQGHVICSPQQNSDLFKATIGGMGLTGIISWAEIQLKPIQSALIDFENIRMRSLDDFVQLSKESASSYEYTVAWIDSTAPKNQLGRGIFMRGNHSPIPQSDIRRHTVDNRNTFAIPITPPFNIMTGTVVKCLNQLYYSKQFKPMHKGQQLYESYFFPLDRVSNWNLMFGRNGFFQYQFVVGKDQLQPLRDILALTASFEVGSFVTVLKAFGAIASPGMMSFPTEGYTLTLDFPNLGKKTAALFFRFEEILMKTGGRVYAAKDAVSSADFYLKSYQHQAEFRGLIDPKFSSSLWRRVTNVSKS